MIYKMLYTTLVRFSEPVLRVWQGVSQKLQVGTDRSAEKLALQGVSQKLQGGESEAAGGDKLSTGPQPLT